MTHRTLLSIFVLGGFACADATSQEPVLEQAVHALTEPRLATQTHPEMVVVYGDYDGDVVSFRAGVLVAPDLVLSMGTTAAGTRVVHSSASTRVREVAAFETSVPGGPLSLLRLEAPIDASTYATLNGNVTLDASLTVVGAERAFHGSSARDFPPQDFFAQDDALVARVHTDKSEFWSLPDVGDGAAMVAFLEGTHELVGLRTITIHGSEGAHSLHMRMEGEHLDWIAAKASEWGRQLDIVPFEPPPWDGHAYEEFLSVYADGEHACWGVLIRPQVALTLAPCAPNGKSLEVKRHREEPIDVVETALVERSDVFEDLRQYTNFALLHLAHEVVDTSLALPGDIGDREPSLTTVGGWPSHESRERAYLFPYDLERVEEGVIVGSNEDTKIGSTTPLFVAGTHELVGLTSTVGDGADNNLTSRITSEIVEGLSDRVEAWGYEGFRDVQPEPQGPDAGVPGSDADAGDGMGEQPTGDGTDEEPSEGDPAWGGSDTGADGTDGWATEAPGSEREGAQATTCSVNRGAQARGLGVLTLMLFGVAALRRRMRVTSRV